MEENYWTRQRRYSRRSIIRGAGLAAGIVTLAPVIAACGSSNKNNNANKAATTPSGVSTTTSAGTATSTSGGTTATSSVAAGWKPSPDEAKAVRGGTLTLSIFADYINFDTTKTQDVYSNYMIGQVCEALVATTTDFKVAPVLAQSIETPDDHTYLFKLKQGVKFHDGTDFTADAVKASLQRHIDNKASVRNADVKTITDMSVVDPTTLKITLSEPFAPFLNKIAGGAGIIYSPTAVQKLGDKLASDLTGAGTGPFKFVEWAKGDHGTVQANDAYWQKAPDGKPYPYLSKVIMKVIPDENVRLQSLKAGETDWLGGLPPNKDIAALKLDSSLIYKEIPGLGFSFFNLNVTKPPFDKKEVRQAFAIAIDRDQLLKTVFFGVGTAWDTQIPSAVPGSDPSLHPYLKQDLNKAKSLLQQAGLTGKVPFSMEFSSSSPIIQQTVELVKDQISGAGFDMSLAPKEFSVVIDDGNKANYQAESIGWSAGIDPDDYVYNLFQSKAGFNLAHYNSPQIDTLLQQGRTTLDIEKRKPIYQQILKTLADDEPFIIYYVGPISQATSKKIANYQLGPNIYSQIFRVWKTA
ncbi:MAG: ABC transporter substrate-binding protein [Dehalococcoidia bacterium]